MITGISRRVVLRGFGQSVALGTLAVSLPRHLAAAQAAQGAKPGAAPAKKTICLSMFYPAGEGLKFDGDKFRDQHVPVLKNAYGAGLERVELRVSEPAPEGAAAQPLLAAVSMWISDVSKFIAGANSHAKEVSASMATITNSAPMVQYDQVIATYGAERSTVAVGTTCISQLFQAKEGATWNAQGVADEFMKNIYEAYGSTALRRIEVCEGAQGGGGGAPLWLGGVHMYVADGAAFDAAAKTDAVKQLAADGAKYWSTPPIPALMKVQAVG